MKHVAQLHWPLISGLGMLALVYPVGRSSGLLQRIGEPVAALLVAALISAVWLAAVVGTRIRRPVLTLSLTGLIAALVRIVLSTLLAPLLGLEEADGGTGVVALGGVLLAHTLWGWALGLVAKHLQTRLRTRAANAAQEGDES